MWLSLTRVSYIIHIYSRSSLEALLNWCPVHFYRKAWEIRVLHVERLFLITHTLFESQSSVVAIVCRCVCCRRWYCVFVMFRFSVCRRCWLISDYLHHHGLLCLGLCLCCMTPACVVGLLRLPCWSRGFGCKLQLPPNSRLALRLLQYVHVTSLYQ